MKDLIDFMIKMESQDHQADLADINSLITLWNVYSKLPVNLYDTFPTNYQIFMMYADLKYIWKFYQKTKGLPYIKYNNFGDTTKLANRWRVWVSKQYEMEQDLNMIGEVINDDKNNGVIITITPRAKVYLKKLAAEAGMTQKAFVSFIITNYEAYKDKLPKGVNMTKVKKMESNPRKKYSKERIDWNDKEQVKEYHKRSYQKSKNKR